MPFFEFGYTFVQVSPGVELWVLDLLDRDLGEGVSEEDAKIGGEAGECVVSALQLHIVMSIGRERESFNPSLPSMCLTDLESVDEDQ